MIDGEGSEASSSSSSWTGWAVSSLTSRIYGGQQGAVENGNMPAAVAAAAAEKLQPKGSPTSKAKPVAHAGKLHTSVNYYNHYFHYH